MLEKERRRGVSSQELQTEDLRHTELGKLHNAPTHAWHPGTVAWLSKERQKSKRENGNWKKEIGWGAHGWRPYTDRKSTRLNSSHVKISYAVFCLKKKKNIKHTSESLQQLR